MQNIFIGIPSYDNNIPILMNELLNNIKNRSQYKDYVKIVFKIGMPVHKARNFLVNDFIQDQSCGYLLMIDADNPISVEGFDRLVDDMVEDRTKHIICGVIVSRKKTGLGKYCIAVTDEKINQFGYSEPKEWYTISANKRLVAVDNCGTGCVLYSREVIEKVFAKYGTIYEFETERYIINDTIKNKKIVKRDAVPLVNIDENFFFPFRDELCGDGELKLKMIDVATIPQSHYKCQAFGEDIYGHRRMKSLGYKIRLDTTVIGRHIISWNESTTITHDMYSGLVLSIIIPVYNNTKFIKQIYEHIKKTVKVKHEIIFVNDGSTKESGVLKELKKLRLVKTIDNKINKGTNVAWMEGIKEAKGKYIRVINDDILWQEGLPEKLIDSLNDDNIVACPLSTTGNKLFQGDVIKKQGNICGRCWMCDRSVFISKIGLIPQTLKLWFGDDWIFHRVVEDLKKGVIIVGSPLCHHFESQTIGKKFTGKMKQIIDVDRNEWINILEKKGRNDFRFKTK